jgi:hypothetical protein
MTSVAYGLAFPATRGVLAFQASGFNPTTLFAGNTGGWWDVSDMSKLFEDSAGTTPVTAADQPVGRIEDKSGNGNLILQATSTKRPYLRISGALWWLEFDGVDDFLRQTFTLNNPISRVSAAQLPGWTNNVRVWDGGAAYALLYQFPSPSPTVTMLMSGNGPTTTELTLGTNHVITEIFNGASSKIVIDNGADHTGDPGTANPGGVTIGSDHNNNSYRNVLWFGAIWIGRVLTDPEIADCRTYFGAKAGLSL